MDFIKAQESFSYSDLLMMNWGSSKRVLKLFVSLKKKSGRSLENPPKDSKTAGS